MKKTLLWLILGAIAGVVVWLNIQRFMGDRTAPLLKGGEVLPPVSNNPIPSDAKANPTRAAAAELERVVVNIDTIGRPVTDWSFFGPRYVTPQGSGSGVVVRQDGFVVTNNHVIQGAQTITVTFHDGSKVKGELWGADPQSDLAVVKVNKTNLPYARFGDSDKVRVGDSVIAVGNSLGLGTTVTSGIISARERMVGDGKNKALEKAIQTDAAINRGNSGGALALMNGDVIGINTAILSTNQGGGNIGIGFAIPSNTVRQVVSHLIKDRKVSHPVPVWLGVQYQPMSPDLAQQVKDNFGLSYPSPTEGVVVRGVVPGSPASVAGIKPLDNILAVDGEKVRGEIGLSKIIQKHKAGDVVKVRLYRVTLQKEFTLDVTLTAVPENPQNQEENPSGGSSRSFRLPF